MTEEWRQITGFEGFYEVSSLGRVRSLPRDSYFTRYGKRISRHHQGRIIKPGVVQGYLQVKLGKNPVQVQKKVHALVLVAFRGHAPAGFEGRHLDGVRANCALHNLTWGTKLENAQDKFRHGTMSQGEKHPRAKLKVTQIVEIRDTYARGGVSQEAIAGRFGTTQTKISEIVNRKTWKHVP